jgi:hypothetical protein
VVTVSFAASSYFGVQKIMVDYYGLWKESADLVKDECPVAYSAFEWSERVALEFRCELVDCYRQCSDEFIPLFKIVPGVVGFSDEITLTKIKKDLILDFLPPFRGDCIAVAYFWDWGCQDDVVPGTEVVQPKVFIGLAPNPFEWSSPIQSPPKKQKSKSASTENDLEKSLIKWLHACGVKADSQVVTSRHRTDIWIPGVCFLELKKAKISGDDVCQAIDYCAEYKKTIVLVGNHIGEMASRGIEGFNKSVGSEMIVFVSWSGVRTYLKGLLSL